MGDELKSNLEYIKSMTESLCSKKRNKNSNIRASISREIDTAIKMIDSGKIEGLRELLENINKELGSKDG